MLKADSTRPLYVALLAAVLALVGIVAAHACGTERWPVKVGADRDIASVMLGGTAQKTTITELAALPAPANPNAQRDTRFKPVELHAYTVTATITLIKREEDGDYHIVLRDGDATMIVEAPDPACAPGSAVAAQIAGVRHVIDQRMGKITGRRPHLSVPVTVTGIGFFDKLHGQEGVAKNGIELHPVLEITFGSPQ